MNKVNITAVLFVIHPPFLKVSFQFKYKDLHISLWHQSFFFLQTVSLIFEGHSEFEGHLFIGVLTAVYGYYPEMCDTYSLLWISLIKKLISNNCNADLGGKTLQFSTSDTEPHIIA